MALVLRSGFLSRPPPPGVLDGAGSPSRPRNVVWFMPANGPSIGRRGFALSRPRPGRAAGERATWSESTMRDGLEDRPDGLPARPAKSLCAVHGRTILWAVLGTAAKRHSGHIGVATTGRILLAGLDAKTPACALSKAKKK